MLALQADCAERDTIFFFAIDFAAFAGGILSIKVLNGETMATSWFSLA